MLRSAHLVRLEIAPYPVDCLGAFLTRCLQVRESSIAPFVSLNGQFIEFMFQEGVRSFIVADKSLSSDLTPGFSNGIYVLKRLVVSYKD